MQEVKMDATIYMGLGSLDYLKKLKSQTIFLVTDPFMQTSGLLEQVMQRIGKNNKVLIFSDIVPDPPIEVVTKGVIALLKMQANCLIAFGGGSAIDAAKAMKFFVKKMEHQKELCLIAIPTTSGTGSEVTDFAVITNQQNNTKYPLVDGAMLPNIAILDSSLVASVPKNITADTGIDVLTHALEAYVSTKATDFSDAYAEKAFCYVFEYLDQAYQDGNNQTARENMHIASCLAGLAFNQASLGFNHGLAHALGARLHIPHGRLNGIILPKLIKFNARNEQSAKKYAQLYRLISSEDMISHKLAVQQLVRHVEKLLRKLDMPLQLSEVPVAKKELDAIREEVVLASLADACTQTNPIIPSVQQANQLLSEIF